MGLPRVGRRHGDVAPKAERRGGSHPQPGPSGLVALLLAESRPFPLRRAQGVDRDLLDEFLYRLYGMYLAVLAARMAASKGDQPGHGDSLFPEQPRPRPRDPYPWDAFVGPLPADAVRHQPRLQLGVPADWRWPQDFIHDLIRWARALAWMPEPAEVSWAELALDYEAFVGRALPASPDHRLRGTGLTLGERAQVLRKAVGLAEHHLAAGALLGGGPTGALPLAPPPRGPRVRGAFGSPVLRGAPRSHAAADAPSGALPRLPGPAPASASAHAATAQ